ncbi:MAG TPA: serine acetyltransferase [Ideonella sp.]|uniref:serine O-acetyltransferase n=1 Tax=Ideonella sp. TaxID=1929293 RepID=UPI002B9B8157|nr:serine acetyltransferase [Ideonella sp.]HSI50358.1 serine acetyltransferase [Ideonella sp.]
MNATDLLQSLTRPAATQPLGAPDPHGPIMPTPVPLEPVNDALSPADAQLDLDQIVTSLRTVRLSWREASGRSREPAGRELPSPDTVAHIMDDLCGVLFPMRLGPPELRPQEEDIYVRRTLGQTLQFLQGQVRLELAHDARLLDEEQRNRGELPELARQVVNNLARSLPVIRSLLDSDVAAAFHGQPSARNVDEILLCCPGVRAMIHHRVAHRLHRLGARLLARMVSDLAHSRTGIDIHPGATIGAGCFIDHGNGVVIGEGVRIGRQVRIHQAVTLDAGDSPRQPGSTALLAYPTVGDDVVLHAGATVLGGVSIGQGARIGGNVWLTDDVPAGALVSQATLRQGPARP